MSAYGVQKLNLKCSTWKGKTAEIKAELKFSKVAAYT